MPRSWRSSQPRTAGPPRGDDYVRDNLGKKPIQAGDRGGFVVTLLIPYLVSAIRMYESGYASRKTSTPAW